MEAADSSVSAALQALPLWIPLSCKKMFRIAYCVDAFELNATSSCFDSSICEAFLNKAAQLNSTLAAGWVQEFDKLLNVSTISDTCALSTSLSVEETEPECPAVRVRAHIRAFTYVNERTDVLDRDMCG
jgi:hypothetical protein